MPDRVPPIKGFVAQVDPCPNEAGFILSLGPVSLWLERATAQDVIATLTRALTMHPAAGAEWSSASTTGVGASSPQEGKA